MSESMSAPALSVFTSEDSLLSITRSRERCVDLIADAYRAHAVGDCVNPESTFLRLPDSPGSRIISLPAYLGGPFEVAGIKWISSFPSNHGRGLPRASAALILNDIETGYPYAVLEAATISATRTAASAVLAAELLIGSRSASRIGIVGTGFIASNVMDFLRDLNWRIDEVVLCDTSTAAAEKFRAHLAGRLDSTVTVRCVSTPAEAFSGSDLMVVTTIAMEPHLDDCGLLVSNPVVLHLSLRDLSPAMILASQNFTDDKEHALREGTSLYLTGRQEGNSEFLAGTIGDLLGGTVTPDTGKPRVFSPFGLGILDLAVAKLVHDDSIGRGGGTQIPNFFQAPDGL